MYDLQTELLEKRISGYGLDEREKETMEDLASTIRIISGLDAAGNKINPYFEGEDDSIPYEAIDTLKTDAQTGLAYVERRYQEHGQTVLDSSPNRVARLTLNFRNTLLLNTVKPTHYRMIVNTRYSDLNIKPWLFDVSTPGMPAFWRSLGVIDSDKIANIDLASFSLAEIPYEHFSNNNHNSSYKEWIRYLAKADTARSKIIELLNQQEISLDSVNSLKLPDLLPWMRRVEEKDFDERLEWVSFFQELATDHEVNSPDNKAGWKKIRVYNDPVYRFYTDRVKKGALAGRYRFTYMLPVGAQFPLSALGAEGSPGTESLSIEQRARMILHLGYAINAKDLLESPGFNGSQKFNKLLNHFNKHGSLNGLLLQDFLDTRYYLVKNKFGQWRGRGDVSIRKYDQERKVIVGKTFAEVAELAKTPKGQAEIAQLKADGEFFHGPTRITILDLMVLGGLKVVSEDKKAAWIKQGREIIWRGKMEYDEHAGTLQSDIYKMFLQKLAKERGVDFKLYEQGDTYAVSVLNNFAQEHLAWRKTMLTNSTEDMYPFGFDSYTSFHTFLNMMVCDSSWVNFFNTDIQHGYRDLRALGAVWESLEFGITATLSKDKTKRKDTHLNHVKIVSDKGDVLADLLHGNGYKEVQEFSRYEMEITRTPRGSIGWIPYHLEFMAIEELLLRTWEWQRKARGDTDSPTQQVLAPDQIWELIDKGFKNIWVVGEWNEFYKKKFVRWGIWKGDWARNFFKAYRFFVGVSRENEKGNTLIEKFNNIKAANVVPFGLGNVIDFIVPLNPMKASTWLYFGGVAFLVATGGGLTLPVVADAMFRMFVARLPLNSLPFLLTHKGAKDLTTLSPAWRNENRRVALGRSIGAGIGMLIPFAFAVNPLLALAAGVATAAIGGRIARDPTITQKLFIPNAIEDLGEIMKKFGERLTDQFGSKM